MKAEHTATATATITAILVDDEPLAREELAFLLKVHPEIHLVAQGKNGLEAYQLIKEHQPDLLFLDVAMLGWMVWSWCASSWIKKARFRFPI